MTIVEVLVGVVLVSLVLAAVVTATLSAGHAQQRSKVRQQMAAAADNVLDQLRVDKAWTGALDVAACTDRGCPIVLPDDVAQRLQEHRDGLRFELELTGWPVDSDADGVGAGDDDRIVPDYVRVQVAVSMSRAQQERFGTQRPHVTVSTIDMARRVEATGTLVVQTCEATNQIDERASIRACDRADAQALAAQPAPCRDNPRFSLAQLVAYPGSFAIGCNAALDEAKDVAPTWATMQLIPVTNLGFAITLTNDDGTSTSRTRADAETDAAHGTYTFTGLPAGDWQFRDITPGPGRRFWASKSIPSATSVTVPPNEPARALLVQRPMPGRGQHTATFTKTTYDYETTHPERLHGGDTEWYWGYLQMTVTVRAYYDLVVGPDRTTVPGSAWDGIVATEPKPAGRSGNETPGVSPQRRETVRWGPRETGTERVVLSDLPFGLHAAPEFVACDGGPPCGDDQQRTMTCSAGPPDGATTCPRSAVWVPASGQATSSSAFHSDLGECYLDGELVADGTVRGASACGPVVKEGVWVLTRVEASTHCTNHVGGDMYSCSAASPCTGGPRRGTNTYECVVSGPGPCVTPPAVMGIRTTHVVVDGEPTTKVVRKGPWQPREECV